MWHMENRNTLPETNSKFAPENGCSWNTDRFLLGHLGLFSGAKLLLVSGSVCHGVFIPRCCG